MGPFSTMFRKFFNLKTPIEQLFELAQDLNHFDEKKFFKIINKNEALDPILSGHYNTYSMVDLNAQDKNGNTLLHLLSGHSFLSDYLILKGANATLLNHNNETALFKNLHHITQKDLLLIKSTPNEEFSKYYPNGETILTELFQRNKHITPILLQTFIQKGADIHQENKTGHTPLYYASMNTNPSFFNSFSNLPLFLSLTDQGARFNETDINALNLFQKIMKQSFLLLGLPETHKLDQKDENKDTILLKMLKNSVDYTFNDQAEILSHSSETLKRKIIEKVISLSDINEKDQNGIGVIELALTHHRYPFLIPLIEHGADLSFKNNNQETLLHFAVLRNDQKLLEALLKKNQIDINAQDKNGNTPLHLALAKEREELIDILLKYNANPLIQNNELNSCIDLSYKTSSNIIPLKIKIKQLEMENSILSAHLISNQKTAMPRATERQR